MFREYPLELGSRRFLGEDGRGLTNKVKVGQKKEKQEQKQKGRERKCDQKVVLSSPIVEVKLSHWAGDK